MSGKASIGPTPTETSDAQPATSRPADRTPPETGGKHETEHGGAASKTTDQGVPRGMPHIVQRLTLRSVTASSRAGVSERGDLLLDDNNSRHISLLRGPQCDTAARMELPREVEYKCYKAVEGRGRVLVQAKDGADTICLTSEGHEIYRSKSSGWLLTCMADDILCYREHIAGTDKYRIRLQRGGDGTPTYLEPPSSWGPLLSVCRNNDGTYWVTEYHTRSLDIFTTAGRHIRHEDLPYEPSSPNAIAATSSGHVLIAEWYPTAAIHIHDESGRRVGGFTKQQMQVEEDIQGIGYCREDETLTVLAGDAVIRSVQTFRIEYK